MLDKPFVKFILTMILGTIIVAILITKTEMDKHKCNNLGGIYIDRQCFKAEIIKL